MSYYYSYAFTSPEGVYATVKEELKPYFDSGAVDPLMFPTWLNKCLDKLGKSSYYITEDILQIEDFTSRLPDNFYGVREAWLCTEVNGFPYQSPSSFYSQAASSSTIQVSPVISNGAPCTNTECTTGCPDCMPYLIQAVYKTNNEINVTYKREYLLKPGNIGLRAHCELPCLNASMGNNSPDSYDIRDNKFVVNFRSGTVHLIFYATEYDDQQNQMIPDNYRIREYIEAFLKFKIFELLTNTVIDETFNQLQQKMLFYKQLSDEAFIMAKQEIQKQTVYQKLMGIERTKKSFQKYELPSSRFRGTWRRQN